MFLRRKSTIAVVSTLLVLVGADMLWQGSRESLLEWWQRPKPPLPPSSALAFKESYLDAAAGRIPTHRTSCRSCHPLREGFSKSAWDVLHARTRLSRSQWASAIQLQARCGSCHVTPDPSVLTWPSWSEVITKMRTVMDAKGVPPPTSHELEDILHFYYTFSLSSQRPLDPDPDPAESPVRFHAQPMGQAPGSGTNARPIMTHVETVRLQPHTPLGVLACDASSCTVSFIQRTNGAWQEDVLARLPHPAQAHVVPGRLTNCSDVIVACLGTLRPCDDLVGRVVLLSNDGQNQFSAKTLLEGCSRVADVQAGDFDHDGNPDFVVAIYGYLKEGDVGWLKSDGQGGYQYRSILKKTGAINVLPVDLNGDGHLDFVALFAQEHEEISAFINDGQGNFTEHILFRAATPSYGSSGIQLVDLDQDGDLDILYTNGDNMDLQQFVPRPYQGVQWLENKGGLRFVWHDLYRFYGAYSAAVGDLNQDGKPDIVVSSLFNDWKDPQRASLIWLENLGQQRFRPHTIARSPIHLVSTALGDFEGDGRLDVVACGMNAFPPFERIGRVMRWRNEGAAPAAGSVP